MEKSGLVKAGGISAIYGALAYIVAVIFFLVVLDYPNVTDITQKVNMIVDNQNIIKSLHWISYILFGTLLVVLSLALREKIHVQNQNESILNVATVFGVVWAALLIASGLISNQGIDATVDLYHVDVAQAEILWSSIEVVSSALSFVDGEWLGGLWMLLIGFGAMKVRKLSKSLNLWCVGIGLVGIISVIPMLHVLSALFGLGQIVWFIWLGIHLLKSH